MNKIELIKEANEIMNAIGLTGVPQRLEFLNDYILKNTTQNSTKSIKTVKELAVSHDYYCSDSNFYSNDPGQEWDTVKSFLDNFGDADVDMNLVFRFDVVENDDGTYSAHIYIIHQRKGIFAPHKILKVLDSDVENLVKYLTLHKSKIDSIWNPITNKIMF